MMNAADYFRRLLLSPLSPPLMPPLIISALLSLLFLRCCAAYDADDAMPMMLLMAFDDAAASIFAAFLSLFDAAAIFFPLLLL